MIDWKIIAASFASLLVVSSVLVGGAGSGILSDVMNKINEWLGTSPFTGFLSSSKTSEKSVEIFIKGEGLDLSPSSPVNISIDGVGVRNFRGEIGCRESGCRFVSDYGTEIVVDAENVSVDGFEVENAVFEGIDFNVESSGMNTIGKNGTLEVFGFRGRATFSQDSVILKGNVSLVKGNHKDLI